MKITDTNQILKVVDGSDNLFLKIGIGKNQKAIWCPSFKAQKSKDPQAISDSVCETFHDIDCHLRNLNSVSDVETEYATPHIYIGTAKSIEQSNITPEFIEKIAKKMSDKWALEWNRQRLIEMEQEIQYQYGSDCYYGHLIPRPTDMKKLVKDEHTNKRNNK